MIPSESPRAPAPAPADVLLGVAEVAGMQLAHEVEEYFEHGAVVNPGDVVIDVGANVGAFAAAVAMRTRGDVTVHCFEAAAPIFTQLQRNFAAHSVLRDTRHELHAVALCAPEQHGEVRPFYYFQYFPTDSTYDIDRKLAGFRQFFRRAATDLERRSAEHALPARALGKVLARTLTHLARDESRLGPFLAMRLTGARRIQCGFASLERVLADRGIERVDLLKIDVEGAELDVLRGCGASWPHIRRVVLETDSRAGRVEEVKALLLASGMRITSCRPPRIADDGDRDLILICAERA
jgi:FkbM family methyltransferase